MSGRVVAAFCFGAFSYHVVQSILLLATHDTHHNFQSSAETKVVIGHQRISDKEKSVVGKRQPNVIAESSLQMLSASDLAENPGMTSANVGVVKVVDASAPFLVASPVLMSTMHLGDRLSVDSDQVSVIPNIKIDNYPVIIDSALGTLTAGIATMDPPTTQYVHLGDREEVPEHSVY